MVFTWLRRRRRKRLIQGAFPANWETFLDRHVRHVQDLTPPLRQKHRDCVRVFVHEKYWEGCRGFQIDDEVRVTIAGHACLLLLGFEDQYFDNVQSILVYPETYRVETKTQSPVGVETEREEARIGEAWQAGPVILAWDSVPRADGAHQHGHNVVLHEFAHCLDAQDRDFDGTPGLLAYEQYRTWHDVMTREYNRLVHASRRGRATLLDHYGATSPAEFFAVATECFFECSAEMAAQHADLYNILRDFFRQDPASRPIT